MSAYFDSESSFRDITRQLVNGWERAHAGWKDEVAQQFEDEFAAPILAEATILSNELERLMAELEECAAKAR